jgi:hypothetical protein
MLSVSAKAAHLLRGIDLSRPELAPVREEDDQDAALLDHLQAPPRRRFLFEYERKAEMLAFLREHYAGWQAFDTAYADRLAAFTIAQAQGPRALMNVSVLGKAWWATGDTGYGAAFQRFYLETATGEMFNWGDFNGSQSAHEIPAYLLLLDCPGFTADGRIAFLDHLYAIVEDAWDGRTTRWPQIGLGPEGHNWYIHGMHGVPYFGLLFPEFTRSREFLHTGWSVVEEHVRGHYRADGGARETTPGYQQGTLICLWELYLIAHRNGHPVTADFVEKLLNATRFLLRLMTPDGSVPPYGDSGYTPGGLTTLAATAAAVTGDRECKWYAEKCRAFRAGVAEETPGQLPETAFWLNGLEGAAAYAKTRAQNPRHISVLMGDTGYAALRDGDRYLAIAAADRGPIVTSHGHNDIFALEVHAGGERLLGQPAIAPYGESPGRDYDESTAAHSTLTIAGMEQAATINEWRWSQVTIPAVRRWISEETHDFFHGVHEGFYRYPDHQVLHARKVFFMKSTPSYWVVLDWLDANVNCNYEVYFHGCRPGRIDHDRILLGGDGAGHLAIVPPAGDRLTLAQVDNEGSTAYYRETGRSPVDFPAFVYRKHSGSTCLAWVLSPGETPAVCRLPVNLNGQSQSAWGATALEITFSGHTDLFCLSHRDFDGVLEFGAYTTFAFLSFRRVLADGTEASAIDHTMADGCCGR